MASGHAEITGGFLTEEDLKANGWHVDPDGDDDNDDSYFYITESGTDDVQLIDGEITVVPGDRKQLVELDGGLYDFDVDEVGADAERIVELVKARGGKINGIIIVHGDEDENRWPSRFRFADTEVHHEYPSLTWADGTDANGYY